MTRTFTAKPAVLEPLNLFLGIVGPSSSGKTFSALRLATGIQRVVGGDIHLIDTENRRATAYSRFFKFQHVQFDPPFGSLDYLEALQQSAAAGAKTIIVDSASHEHESIGGLLDAHETELDRLAGDNYGKRQAMAMLAWQKPKSARRKLLQGLTRLNCNVIMCFRAKQTSKPIKGANGKTEIVPMGFVPIAGDEFVYEMSMGCFLPPNSDGVPDWHPEMPGERMAVKLPAQFRGLIPEGEALSEDIGEALAKWAQGVKPAPTTAPDNALLDALTAAAAKGTAALVEAWKAVPKAQKPALERIKDEELKPMAAEADKAMADPKTVF